MDYGIRFRGARCGRCEISLTGSRGYPREANIDATFLAEQHGPHFDMNLAIKNTDMTSMNNLLLAFGSFDVKHG
jgi:hypothetical protein